MVIPAYNESESIETIVKEFLKTRFVTKVLVIDNHSTDKTAEIAEKAGATVIRKNANTGFGHSVALLASVCLSHRVCGYSSPSVTPPKTFTYQVGAFSRNFPA